MTFPQFTAYLFTTSVRVTFSPLLGTCGIFLSTQQPHTPVSRTYEISMVISYVVPVFIVLFSCSLSIWRLTVRSGAVTDSSRVSVKCKRKASKTIVIFGFVYLVFNVPLAVYQIMQATEVEGILAFDYGKRYVYYVGDFCFTGSVVLNSAINPFLYFWRIHKFRRFFLDQENDRGLSRNRNRGFTERRRIVEHDITEF